MANWRILKCPNSRRNNKSKPCAWPLKMVSGVERDKEEYLFCGGCGAQCHVKYGHNEQCTVTVLPKRIKVSAKEYPFIASGSYVRGSDASK